MYQIALKYAEVSREEIQTLFYFAVLLDVDDRMNLISEHQEIGIYIPTFCMRILDSLCQAYSQYVWSEMAPPASACSETEDMFSNLRM